MYSTVWTYACTIGTKTTYEPPVTVGKEDDGMGVYEGGAKAEYGEELESCEREA